MITNFKLPKFGIICVTLLIVSAFCYSQSYNFTTLSTIDGLSSNTVNVIEESADGLTWFGTPDGLNKFDGTNFSVYRFNPDDKFSLPGNEVRSIYRDKKGRLWVGTSNGLAYYDTNNNNFVRYDAFNGASVRALCEDNAGNLWVGSYAELRILNLHSGKVKSIPVPAVAARFNNIWAILSLYKDKKGQMWVGSTLGLYLYDNPETLKGSFIHNDFDEQSISGNYITDVIEDKQNRMWLATTDGFNMLMPNGKFRVYKDMAGKGTNNIHSVKLAPGNELWLATDDGLVVFNTLSLKYFSIKSDKRRVFGLRHNAVKSIYISPKGIYWIGLTHSGVNKFDKSLALFNLQRSNFFDPQGLRSPIVTSFAEDINEKIFVGTDKGVQIFDKTTRLFTPFQVNNSVLSMLLDSRRNLWIGTFQNGLVKVDLNTGSSRQFLAASKITTINENDIFCMTEDRYGNIWIGTNGGGINVYNPKTGIFKKYEKQTTIQADTILPSNGFIRSIIEMPDGDIWIGSYGPGIAVLNPKTGKFKQYTRYNSGLGNDFVFSIINDKKGRIWAGTNGGLSLFDKKTKKFHTYSEKNGLANRVIHKILEDRAGVLWLSTNNGISSFDPKTKLFKNFSRYNGVQESPFITGSGMRSSDGELFFGGGSGFNFFNPTQLPANKVMPSVLLTELKVSNNTVNPENGAPIEEAITVAKQIELDYGQNFSISYVALNYTNPQQNHYSYKLEGFDDDWNTVGNAKTAYYTNLDPGDYVFHVRASNNDGVWSKSERTVNVKVHPPIFRTVYAYIFYLLAALTVLLYIRRNGIRKIRMEVKLDEEKRRAKELIEQERREAEKLHELDLIKIKFLTNLSHEFRTPISLIMAPVDKLLSVTSDTFTVGQANVIKRNARRLLNLVNQLLDFRKMEEQELKLNMAPGDLVAFIKDAVDSFHDLSERKKINLTIDSEVSSLPANFDHDKIERIVFNLLSNAFKFTLAGGQINVNLFLEQSNAVSHLIVQVKDTGIGIPVDQQHRIFDHFFQHETIGGILNQGSGIGLAITREFVRMLGGEITVKSEVEKGSVFTFDIPVNPIDNQKLIPAVVDNNVEPEKQVAPVEDKRVNETSKLPVVLIVEDNEDFRFYLKDNLKGKYQILEAIDGKDGWQKTLSGHPQLIVSDISMPNMNGIELSKKIKADKRTSHIPVILLTALVAEEDQIKGLESGANDYLTKPFNFEILSAKIKNILALNRTLKDTYSKHIQIVPDNVEIESADAKLMSTIVKYIEANLDNPDLSVEHLSKHVGMSRGSLYRKILELTGLSPIEYIRAIKLDKAAVLLEKSNFNIAQVAYMIGFGTPNYFARMFKDRFQMPPSQYIALKRKPARERLETVNSEKTDSR